MEAINQTLSDMMVGFTKRMDSFDESLRKKTAPALSLEGLAEDFAAFKNLVLGSLRALQMQVSLVAKELDQMETRSRRKILLLHGVAEGQKEDTAAVIVNVVTGSLQLAGFSAKDISRCHRMGRHTTSTKPRPILFKLRDVTTRSKIWSSKSTLKGSGITLSEFLTKPRHDVFMEARQKFGISKCWTMDGTVYVANADGSRHRVRCMEDLSALNLVGDATSTGTPTPTPAPTKPASKPAAGSSKTRSGTALRK